MVLSFSVMRGCLRVEAVRPAPTGHEIRFVRFEGACQSIDSVFRGCFSVGTDCEHMRCGPAKVKWHQRAKQMVPVYRPPAKRHQEVVDNPDPERIGQDMPSTLRLYQSLHRQQRAGRHDLSPHFLQIAFAQPEGLDHRSHIRCRGWLGRLRKRGAVAASLRYPGERPGQLPLRGPCFYVREESADDAGEQSGNVKAFALGEMPLPNLHLGYRTVPEACLSGWPHDSVFLTFQRALRFGRKSVAEVRGEGKVST